MSFASAATNTGAHLRCSQCLAESDAPEWMEIYADTIYRGFALCLRHFRLIRDKDALKSG